MNIYPMYKIPSVQKPFFPFIAFLLIHAFTFAQSTLTVSVSDVDRKPLDGITVYLLRAKDSLMLKTALSNAQGIAEFEQLPSGDYRVKAGSLTHQARVSAIVTLNGSRQTTGLQLANKDAIALKDVELTTQKPFIQRLPDRMVVNVGSSVISAGSNALDVLERSPGVMISQSDQVSLKGKAGVIIMIDGKPSPMSGADLANYLRTLPSDAIDRIEIITNPSSRYDAAGNSGIIDIRMKKDQRLGTNGSVTATYGQGKYVKPNAGTVLNFRNKVMNVFGNVNAGYAKNFNNIESLKRYYTNGIYTSAYDQDNRISRATTYGNLRGGADFFPGKRTIIGFIVAGNRSSTDRSSNNSSLVLDQNNALVSTFNTRAAGTEKYGNFNSNLNYKYSFKEAGRELTADADYARFVTDWASNFNTGYYTSSGSTQKPAYITNSDQDGNLGLKTIKSDYTHPFKGGKLESGFKSSWVKADNQVQFFDRSGGTPVLDLNRSNHFIYHENINAVYVNASKTFGKLGTQAGLRLEQTAIKTYQVEYNALSRQRYAKLFPTVFLSYQATKTNSIGWSLSRRIDRPSYSQLNPFKVFVDPSFLSTGVPSLRPQYTWSSEFSFTHKQFNATLNYSHTSDYITTLLIPIEDKVTLQTPVNYTSLDYYGVSASWPVKLASWWNAINNLNVFYGSYDVFVANTDINQGSVRGEVSMNNAFSLPRKWTVEINGRYNAGSNEGGLRVKPSLVVSTGFQKTLLENRATLRFNVTDILWRQWPRAVSTFTDYSDVWVAKRDTRVANLSFSYRFGNNQVAGARRRTTGSEDERRRAGGS